MSKFAVTRNEPGIMEGRFEMSENAKQEVVRVGAARLREPLMHMLGDRLNYSEAEDRSKGCDLIVLPVPMGELFDVEVFELHRIRLIPKTSLAASLLWEWLGRETKQSLTLKNAQHSGKDNVAHLELTFTPRAKPAPEPETARKPRSEPKAAAPRARKKSRRGRSPDGGGTP